MHRVIDFVSQAERTLSCRGVTDPTEARQQ